MSGPLGAPSREDMTARARIRDAAVSLFAERGIKGTSVREIAAEAGVSLGLVRHHFGSKEDLRAACDAYVLDRLMRLKEEILLDGRQPGAGPMPGAHPVVLFLLRYFARSVADGSPAADAMFAELVGSSQRWVQEHHGGRVADPGAYASLLVATEVGLLVMRAQVSRQLGADILGPDGHLRLSRAKLEFYSKPLLDEGSAELAYKALDRLEREHSVRRRSGTGRAASGGPASGGAVKGRAEQGRAGRGGGAP